MTRPSWALAVALVVALLGAAFASRALHGEALAEDAARAAAGGDRLSAVLFARAAGENASPLGGGDERAAPILQALAAAPGDEAVGRLAQETRAAVTRETTLAAAGPRDALGAPALPLVAALTAVTVALLAAALRGARGGCPARPR